MQLRTTTQTHVYTRPQLRNCSFLIDECISLETVAPPSRCGGRVPSCLPREGRVLGGKVRTTGVGCRLAVPLPPSTWARPVLATASQVERSCHQSDANIPGSSLQVGGRSCCLCAPGVPAGRTGRGPGSVATAWTPCSEALPGVWAPAGPP